MHTTHTHSYMYTDVHTLTGSGPEWSSQDLAQKDRSQDLAQKTPGSQGFPHEHFWLLILIFLSLLRKNTDTCVVLGLFGMCVYVSCTFMVCGVCIFVLFVCACVRDLLRIFHTRYVYVGQVMLYGTRTFLYYLFVRACEGWFWDLFMNLSTPVMYMLNCKCQ